MSVAAPNLASKFISQQQPHFPTHFPSYVRMWVHPGIISHIKTRGEITARCEAILAANPPAHMRSILLKQAFIFMEEDRPTLHIPDPVFYEQACDYVDQFVLKKPLSKSSPKELLKIFREIHKKIIDPQHPNLEGLPPGAYRIGPMRIAKHPEHVSHDKPLIRYLQNLQKKQEEAQGTPQAAVIKRQCDLVKRYMLRQDVVPSMKHRDRDFLEFLALVKEHYVLFPPPEEIEGSMGKFAVELLERLKRRDDAVSIASWAHLQLVDIHPHEDGNGRLSRMLLNIILIQGGHQAIAFVSDHSYTEAIRAEEAGDRGAFERFVRKLVRQFDYEALPVDKLPQSLLSDKARWTMIAKGLFPKEKMDEKGRAVTSAKK